MRMFLNPCVVCGRIVYRSNGRINESEKYKWQVYCSTECQIKNKSKQIYLYCARKGCNNFFMRTQSDFKKTKVNYCSHSCACIAMNSKREIIFKVCANPSCIKKFSGSNKYCSHGCILPQKSKYTSKIIINKIKKFVLKNRRIPTKQEFVKIYSRTREIFSTWNNAIMAAGFSPNPVMFAKKHIAKDGHACDSFSEKIIDDWLYFRKIKHDRSVRYPGNEGFKTDFKIGSFWVEFFGLSGQSRKYDELKMKKLKLIKRYKLNLIHIYPQDIFPKNKLDIILKNLN